MNRREFLAASAVLAAGRHFNAAAPAKTRLGLVIHSYGIRSRRPLPPDFGPLDALSFAAHAGRLGAGGVQVRIEPRGDAALEELRELASKLGIHLEGIVALPRDEADVNRLETELAAARRAGATVVRTVCLSGRRYEEFDTADAFKAFAAQSWKALTWAEPAAARQRVQLAVENHKDWRTDEMLGWLRRLSSEWVRVCLDTGNNIALLEDPHAVVEALAPFTVTTHIKDMAVAEHPDGFRLAEVPLGDGFLDLPRVLRILTRANPAVQFNLEMITRDPLVVPCLAENYWATLAAVPGGELAAALARARKHAPAGPLQEVSRLAHREQLQAEETNVVRSLAFAHDRLGL